MTLKKFIFRLNNYFGVQSIFYETTADNKLELVVIFFLNLFKLGVEKYMIIFSKPIQNRGLQNIQVSSRKYYMNNKVGPAMVVQRFSIARIVTVIIK